MPPVVVEVKVCVCPVYNFIRVGVMLKVMGVSAFTVAVLDFMVTWLLSVMFR